MPTASIYPADQLTEPCPTFSTHSDIGIAFWQNAADVHHNIPERTDMETNLNFILSSFGYRLKIRLAKTGLKLTKYSSGCNKNSQVRGSLNTHFIRSKSYA
jgi:hypothetical protein